MIVHPDHFWIENVAVAPERQGRGYGRLLLAHAERRAAEAGRVEIRLQTNAAFAANLALYAKVGYAIERTEPFRGGTSVPMSKQLDAHRWPERAKALNLKGGSLLYETPPARRSRAPRVFGDDRRRGWAVGASPTFTIPDQGAPVVTSSSS